MDESTQVSTSPSPDAELAKRTSTALIVTIVALVFVVVMLAVALVVITGRTSEENSQRASDTGSSKSPATTTASASTTAKPASSSAPVPAPDAAVELAAAQDVARRFITAVSTYGPDDLDATGRLGRYEAQVAELITPQFERTFRTAATVAADSVAQAGLERSAVVYGSGVAAITERFVSALVTGAITQSYPDTGGTGRTEYEPRGFRYLVSLDRSSGTWLVSDFTPVDDSFEDPGLEGLAGLIATPARDAQASAERAAAAVLSYDYRSLDDGYDNAVTFMTPGYEAQYSENFDGVVRENAPATRTVVQAVVRLSGVTSVADDRVEVLLFVDRPTRNAGGQKVSRDQATFTMVLNDGEWLVDDIQTT